MKFECSRCQFQLMFPCLALSSVVLVIALLLPIGALAQTVDTPWTGSGSGTTTVLSDGSSAPSQFTYDQQYQGFSGSWEFKTTAASAGTHNLTWDYAGFHAYYQVKVTLDAFIDDGTTVTTINLVNAGPMNCCTSPSAGFHYSGTHTFSVQAGDVYGFKISGSNFDSTTVLQGTLTVDEPPAEVGIDIKPGSEPNCFNSDSHGVIPVAILGSPSFDASTVDPFSVQLDGQEVRVKGKSGNAGSLEDVNNDGFLDLVVQIVDEDTYAPGDTLATLTGLTFDGISITGTDSICITQ